MKTLKIAGWMAGGLMAAAMNGCAAPMLVGAMAGPTVATVSTVAMAAETGRVASQTKWYDGNDFDTNPEAVRQAKLEDAARDIEARTGIRVSPAEVEVLGKLYEARSADLRTFASDRRLTRAQIDDALKTLREKGLVSVTVNPGRPGGYEVTGTVKFAGLGNPLELGREDAPPVYAMNDYR